MLINTLFGSQGMDVKKLADACETTVNTIRYLLNKMDKAMLRTERDGHRLLYDLDLDFLENYNLIIFPPPVNILLINERVFL